MDNLLFDVSNSSEVQSEPFVKRELVYVLDSNNGNYNGQILLDTSSLSNSGKYASYSEAYLQVPLVSYLQANNWAGLNAASVPFAAGLKAGHHHLIHSISVEYNNVSVVQLTPFTNFHVSYKLMTQSSWNDVVKNGSTNLFIPDTPTSMSFNAVGGNNGTGNGVCNNQDSGTTTTTAMNGQFQMDQVNAGLRQRQLLTCYDPASTSYTANFMTTNTCNAVGKDYYVNGGVADNNAVKVWYVLATIRLKDICDFFDKIPLVKGAFIKLTINTNTAVHQLETTVAGGAITNLLQNTAVINGGTTPLMFPSMTTNNGGRSIGALLIAAGNATYTFNYGCGIGKVSVGGTSFQHPTLTGCRLYCPLYTLNPVQEDQYLSLNRQKRIVYKDIYQYQITNIAANNGQINTLLTNGISNAKTVVLIPFLNSAVVGQNGFSPFQSVFDSAPGTTSPSIALTQFNVQVGGINMFVQNENYDFEQFLNELSSINAVNGNLTTGLTSGLIDKTAFEYGYRYYVCDVGRRLPAEDTVQKSIQILGQNASNKAIDLYCFVEFEKSITIDLMTGAKID